ncbi:MAG: hypothetical protein EOP84_08030 [Verrucomicrobiaceae bacterium]|nr:MAG: hypothetical protein EOP84_08030 [Verrucomicrobiaceae bacterium]
MAVNVYQREIDDYPRSYSISGYRYVFLIEVLWPDRNIWPIREWLLDHYGQEGSYWSYHYDSVWFRETDHAMEFKLRWL